MSFLSQCKHLSTLILGLRGKCKEASHFLQEEQGAIRAISEMVGPPEHLP